MKLFKFILPVGYFLRLITLIKVFTGKELKESLTQAGFAIDHQWQAAKGKSVFIIAKKPTWKAIRPLVHSLRFQLQQSLSREPRAIPSQTPKTFRPRL